jgi:hypothetical protein
MMPTLTSMLITILTFAATPTNSLVQQHTDTWGIGGLTRYIPGSEVFLGPDRLQHASHAGKNTKREH